MFGKFGGGDVAAGEFWVEGRGSVIIIGSFIFLEAFTRGWG